MSFVIRPRYRGYDALFEEMVAAVPPGTFYDFTRPIVMYSRKPIAFSLETDNPAYPVRITRERLGDFDIGVDEGNQLDETIIVPQPGAISTLFYLTLGRGRNRITAQEILPSGGGRAKVIEVIATTNTLVYEAFGREISKTIKRADLQKAALYSKYSTRLLDQLSGVGDILPDLQTLKILSTKMLIRSFVHFPATQVGVRNKIEAVTLNTPVFQKQNEGSTYNIESSRIMRAVENLAGQEAHIWFPNLAVTRWLAYVKMANSFRNNFTLLSVRDDLVRVKYKGRTTEHRFDYDAFGQNFLTNLSLNDCFNNITVEPASRITSRIVFQCWTYPLDMQITESTSIGLTRSALDSGTPLDSGIPFDADPVDPWNDGFIGWSFSGRFEVDPVSRPLDSMVAPSINYSGNASAYDGPYTQLLNSNRHVDEINATILASGTMDNEYVSGAVVGLGLTFSNTVFGEELDGRVFEAGVPMLLCVKYVDANNMTNLSGTGIIRVYEPETDEDEFAPVSAGFVYVYFTPYKATESTQFQLTDGTHTNYSDPFKIIAGPTSALEVSNIPDHNAGDVISVLIKTVDAWGNHQTKDGVDKIVQFLAEGGLAVNDPTPKLVWLDGGIAQVDITFATPGTGNLKFVLGSIEATSNTFTVS